VDGYVGVLVVGTIIGFAPKKVKIVIPFTRNYNPLNLKTVDVLKFPEQVAKV